MDCQQSKMRCRCLSGVAFDIFRFEFGPVSAFVDDFRTFVEGVGTVEIKIWYFSS